MATTSAFETFKQVSRRGVGAPVVMLAMLAMLMLPLPPFILDMLFSFNIALSLVILLAVVYVMRPLEFAAFPTVVLMATLLRLALNIASTRVVLLHGHDGPGAAGKVIEAFGEFVIGGNFAVGLVVFAILTIINFVVITKGATRVSEVTARFTLDSMPGKQMAIDADLNAGLLTQDQARDRRQEVREEADFYGSMDGASKFVRGDATAGILILLINIVGGFFVGIMQHGLSAGEAARTYTLLTIGDGLVAQVPSLMLSVATAVIVTRVSKSQDMGKQVIGQVFAQPRALAVAGVVLLVMGLIPGMPNIAFLILASACGAAAWMMKRRDAEAKAGVAKAAAEALPAPLPAERLELGWEDVASVDPVGLEVGYRLIPLVDKNQGGELMGRIKSVRRKLSQELGFLVSAVHIRDNLDLAPNTYRITLMGVPMGEAEVYTERYMAINPGRVHGTLQGLTTRDPAFGLEAVWIEGSQRDHAQSLGYTVVDPATVIATHLSHLLQNHAHELLSHQDVQQLLDRLATSAPKLVEDLVPKRLALGVVVKVLQNLLAERVPIRNMRSIVESLAEHAGQSQDPGTLTASVRVALGRQIVQEIAGLGTEIPVLTLAPELEQILLSSLSSSGVGGAAVEPGLADRLQQTVAEAAQRQEVSGEPAVLLVQPQLRPWLARFTRHVAQNLHVLAYNEVPDNRRVRLVQALGR
ncbi:flagellar biosynthesis protein FlhA [Rhodanobacter sp. ANJX3]|jgi:flagellar biosynthesis protein FlhA|uniref:flagellar biosynthesis protein FlhA n=1 Tax=unclassified Rhodanobacter TaxID=2621553 RepID=UPI0015CA7DD1|nr:MULTISPECIES: flagellar biosynthesis protein FlhA [unclassified Rhodanobacter]MBB5359945.1 flagellar biosynthesis protein FlhA [Rhodanobacter sp. ANJX3]NYE28865.1 flagellar biosynthesis protein FlhA [Rhodanobacter sp. K2T2]